MSESFDRSQVLGFFIDESQEQVGLLNNLLELTALQSTKKPIFMPII